jgi:hypothetical protein
MADRVLFIGWGTTVRGMEARGLEVFNEALGLLGRMQQDGRIEGFDVVLLEPNGRMNGYVTVKGSAEQINALREDMEFRRSTADANMIVDDLCHIPGYTNEGVASMVTLFQEATERIPQRA